MALHGAPWLPGTNVSDNKPVYKRGRPAIRASVSDNKKDKNHSVDEFGKSKERLPAAARYYSDSELLLNPTKDAWRAKLIKELDDWVHESEGVELMEFIMEKRLKLRSFYEWIEKYNDVADAVEDAKLMMASRRRIGALKRRYDASVMKWDIHTFDPSYDKVNQYHKELQTKEDSSNGTMLLTMINAMDTGIESSEAKAKRLEAEREKKANEQSSGF